MSEWKLQWKPLLNWTDPSIPWIDSIRSVNGHDELETFEDFDEAVDVVREREAFCIERMFRVERGSKETVRRQSLKPAKVSRCSAGFRLPHGL